MLDKDRMHDIGFLLIDSHRSLKKCEDAVRVELNKTKKNLVEWLKVADEEVIAKQIELCSSEETFELLVKEVGVEKAKKVLRHMHMEFQKNYYNRFIL